MPKKILVSAIEVSGDMHAANLIRKIKQLKPDWEVFGIGSEALRQEGVKIYRDLSSKSTVGMLEPFRHLVSYLLALSLLKRIMRKQKPDILLCVDGQGFHLPLAQAAKKLGIKVVYYISPQEWLWGTVEGGKKVAAVCDLIIAIFPEEQDFYQKLGVKTIFNGHPLVDIVRPDLTPQQFREKHGLDERPILALFPGSRTQELRYLLPEYLKLSRNFSKDHNVVIVAVNNSYYTKILMASKGYELTVILKDNYNAMAAAELVLTATGTSTLEAALIGTPLIAVYKMNPLSYQLAVKLLGERMPKYKALPNMLTGREIIPEIIQYGVDAKNLTSVIQKLLSNHSSLQGIRNDLALLKQELAQENVLQKNAAAVVQLLDAQ